MLQLFSHTDLFHFPEGFCVYQRTIDEYSNLQISKEKCSLLKVNNKN